MFRDGFETKLPRNRDKKYFVSNFFFFVVLAKESDKMLNFKYKLYRYIVT